LPSLTARAVQSLMSAAFRGQMAHDETALRKSLQQGRRASAADPPASLYRQCAVEVRQVGDHRIFTVRPHDPMVSPLFGDLSALPPTLLLCGSADILVADARRLAAAAPDKIRYIEEVGLMHVYPLMPFFPEARRAWLEIERFVDRVLPRRLAG